MSIGTVAIFTIANQCRPGRADMNESCCHYVSIELTDGKTSRVIIDQRGTKTPCTPMMGNDIQVLLAQIPQEKVICGLDGGTSHFAATPLSSNGAESIITKLFENRNSAPIRAARPQTPPPVKHWYSCLPCFKEG